MSSNTIGKIQAAALKEYKAFFKEIKEKILTSKEYPEFTISQQVVGQIPWGHNILLLPKLETLQDRLWYAHKTIEL